MAKIDITFGRPELVAVRRAARGGDLRALNHALTADLTDTEDWSDRVHVAIVTIADRLGRGFPAALDQWAQQDWASPAASLLRGGVEVYRAWRIRGADVQVRRPAELAESLRTAEFWLRAAARVAPDDPTPWVYLGHMARVQGAGFQETVERRTELAKRAPDYFYGHYQALMSLSPIWGQPVEIITRMAQEWSAAAVPGSMLAALPFVANVERWRRTPAVRRAGKYPELHEMARQATERMPMTPCRRPSEYRAHNYAAGWYCLVKDYKRASMHFELLGGRPTEWPWAYWAQRPAAAFRYQRFATRFRLP